MRIRVVSILKKDDKEYLEIIKHFIKMSSKYATLENINLFSKELSSSNRSEVEIKKLYTKLLIPYITNQSFNIALDVEGKSLDSFAFSEKLESHSQINFFIGGAFGFEREFLNRVDFKISLSNLTLSHKIAKIILFEQIFRGISILNNHPYHK